MQNYHNRFLLAKYTLALLLLAQIVAAAVLFLSPIGRSRTASPRVLGQVISAMESLEAEGHITISQQDDARISVQSAFYDIGLSEAHARTNPAIIVMILAIVSLVFSTFLIRAPAGGPDPLSCH